MSMPRARHHLAKFIYNPKAGHKAKLLSLKHPLLSLEDIKALLKRYQIPFDSFPTRSAGHATELARQSVKEGYGTVIVAGGDGTVGEAANGLVGTDVNLGILPLGTFMNIARMLSIPSDIEKAVALLK